MSRKLITTAALVALALSSAAGAEGASAAVKSPAKAGKTTSSSRRVAAKRPAGRAPARLNGNRLVYVKGTSTGKGPAGNDECQKIADDINTAYVAAEDYFIEDDTDRWEGMVAAIDELTANGTKRGCAFS